MNMNSKQKKTFINLGSENFPDLVEVEILRSNLLLTEVRILKTGKIKYTSEAKIIFKNESIS